jgi:hypothetical protein
VGEAAGRGDGREMVWGCGKESAKWCDNWKNPSLQILALKETLSRENEEKKLKN